MTNGITNVVGSQSYNCRLYSRVSLMHSTSTPFTFNVFSEMISILGNAATTNFSLYGQPDKK